MVSALALPSLFSVMDRLITDIWGSQRKALEPVLSLLTSSMQQERKMGSVQFPPLI